MFRVMMMQHTNGVPAVIAQARPIVKHSFCIKPYAHKKIKWMRQSYYILCAGRHRIGNCDAIKFLNRRIAGCLYLQKNTLWRLNN